MRDGDAILGFLRIDLLEYVTDGLNNNKALELSTQLLRT